MAEKYWYLLLGIVIGWVFKVPFLIRLYKELKATRDYKEMKRQEHIKRLEKEVETYSKGER